MSVGLLRLASQALWVQYIVLLPPSIVFVSAMAILFECTPLLRTKFGDVLYFFLWIASMGILLA